MTTEQELNEKLTKWARIEKWKPLPQFTSNLNACFKWLVPRVVTMEGILYIGIEFYNWGTEANVWHNNSNQLPLYSHQDKNPAIALCRAIEKLIDGDK